MFKLILSILLTGVNLTLAEPGFYIKTSGYGTNLVTTLVITNTPDTWTLFWSRDLISWTPYLGKFSLEPLKLVEIDITPPSGKVFWKLVEGNTF